MNWDDSQEVDELPAPPRKDIPTADRELLELAARAIGAVRFEEVEGEGYANLHFEDRPAVYAWNPLVHSDDAFNLMTTLQMEVGYGYPDTGDVLVACGPKIHVSEWKSQDIAAATRRAIVRAAAEMGR